MKSLMPFRSLLREEKTLIIACHEKDDCIKREWNKNILLISSRGNVLNQHSDSQFQKIKHCVEENGCRQIIITGNHHTEAVERIMKDALTQPLVADLTFNLHPFSIQYKTDPAFFERALLELNIVQQCNVLLAYDFIQKRIREKKLTVMGVLRATKGKEALRVFYNGIPHNQVISYN
ncbi:carbonic anhydrase [Ohtaekwangia kribbensis]|jgi:carbonic anhydrase|uniref:Carbonic anhydrase n=1 Tax=Ohtaekwangia kribbensis TaxID=688913 RepID=A0ABW3JZP1_9BACT